MAGRGRRLEVVFWFFGFFFVFVFFEGVVLADKGWIVGLGDGEGGGEVQQGQHNWRRDHARTQEGREKGRRGRAIACARKKNSHLSVIC